MYPPLNQACLFKWQQLQLTRGEVYEVKISPTGMNLQSIGMIISYQMSSIIVVMCVQ